jgi:hypothetical protein
MMNLQGSEVDKMKSYEQLKNIQEQLTSLSDSLENMYGAMRNECIKEIVDDKQKYVTQKNEMYSLYEKLENNTSMRMTWIKNKLPWYIIKFCKISSTEISLRGTSIGVNFGKSCIPHCYIEITPKDIGWK